MKILFLGTPHFAIPSLAALCARGWVSAVVTQPPRVAGRGWALTPSPVAAWAREHGLRLWEPERLSSLKDLILSESWDIAVVVAYGKLLPAWLLEHPTHGCLNVHASLLPRWRGAAPIQLSMMMGDSHAGISIMRMEAGLDEGPYWAQRSYFLHENSLFPEVHEALAHLGQEALCHVLEQKAFLTEPTPQSEVMVTYAPKLSAQDSHYLPSFLGLALKRRMHALYPKPGVRASLLGMPLRLLQAGTLSLEPPSAAPGTLLHVDDAGLWVAVPDGRLAITELQYASQAPKSVAQLRVGWPKCLPLGACLRPPE